jgi:hypothetical protein
MPMYDELMLARRHPAQDEVRRPKLRRSVRDDRRPRRVSSRRGVQTSASWR